MSKIKDQVNAPRSRYDAILICSLCLFSGETPAVNPELSCHHRVTSEFAPDRPQILEIEGELKKIDKEIGDTNKLAVRHRVGVAHWNLSPPTQS